MRARFEQRFLARRMARDYLDIYERILSRSVRRLPDLAPLADTAAADERFALQAGN